MFQEDDDMPLLLLGSELGSIFDEEHVDETDTSAFSLVVQEEEEDTQPSAIISQQEQQQQPSSGLSDAPTGMQLTPREYKWALTLKEAVENRGDIDNLSDLMYAQIAMMEQGDISKALLRCFKLQEIRQECGILDTYEDGVRSMQFLKQHYPGFVLSVCHFERDCHQVLMMDITKMDKQVIQRDLKGALAGNFYLNTMMCPDFASIRNGAIFLVECEGYSLQSSLHQMVDFQVISKMWEMALVYPFQLKKIKYFHSPLLWNILISMLRRVLPAEIHSKLQVGHQSKQNLHDMIMVPSPQIASERILREELEALRLRYENEREFSLSCCGS